MPTEWEPQASVGVEEIDAGNRQVFRRLRRLATAVAEGGAASVRTALRSLEVVLSDVHAVEEAWMADQGYPGVREHVRTHRAIAERISATVADRTGSAEARLGEAAASLLRVIEEHIRADDLKLGRFWIARENLRRLAERGPGAGTSLTPIPGTIAPATEAGRAGGAAPDPGAPRRHGAARDDREDQPAARTRK